MQRVVLAVMVLASLVSFAQNKPPAYLDSSLPAAVRAHDLVNRMTLDEKASQLEDWAIAIPRLGVPDYQTWSEALHGVARAGYATVFPQAIGMAATWDTSMVQQMGDVIGIEGRAKYNQAQREDNHRIFYGLTFWSPNINIFRDPRWGRGQETYGEDPFLPGQMGVAFITGVQGDDPDHPKAVATSKHFAVHSGPESLRHGFNVDVSPRDLEETYLPAFRTTVVDGHVKSVMCAYNAIDGTGSLRQHDAAEGPPARRLGIQGLRGLRLRSHCGRRERTSQCARHPACLGPVDRGGHRPVLQHLDTGVQYPGRCRTPRGCLRGTGDQCGRAALHCAHATWIFRSAGRQRAGSHSVFLRRL